MCLLSKNITFCGTSLEGTSTDVLLLDIYKSINVLHDLQYFYYKAVYNFLLCSYEEFFAINLTVTLAKKPLPMNS